MFFSGSMSTSAMHSSTLWMVALGGPNSITCGQILAMKRPSLVPPLVATVQAFAERGFAPFAERFAARARRIVVGDPLDEKTTGATMLLAYLGMRARGNFDDLTMAVMRHARKYGHSSMILHQLGVPTKPTEPK